MSDTQSSKKEEKVNTTEDNEQQSKRMPKWVQVRLFPILVRVIIVLALAGGSLILGLMVGYGIIGDGSPADALKKETWTHIIDIVTEGTK